MHIINIIDVSGSIANVRLQSGECNWVECNSPNCPYPVCSEGVDNGT